MHDPDGYPIQIMSQNFDLHASLQDACRQIVIDGVEQANNDIRRHGDKETREEAGLSVPRTPVTPVSPNRARSPASPVSAGPLLTMTPATQLTTAPPSQFDSRTLASP